MDILQKTQNRRMRAILRCNRYTRVKDVGCVGFLKYKAKDGI